MKNNFINLFAALEAEQVKRNNEFNLALSEELTVKSILSNYRFSDFIPVGKKNKDWKIEDLKAYLITRKEKNGSKKLINDLKHLEEVSKAEDLKEVQISIEWKKNRTWGSNPSAEARINTVNLFNRYLSGSIGGCGYDKESTAVAAALNQSNSFLKLLYTFKESQININNHKLLGYGSGYGILPHLEGGVGVSCYPAIFANLGFKWSQVASGKTFNAYLISVNK